MGIETYYSCGLLRAGVVELPRAVWELKQLSRCDVSKTLVVELPRAVWELKLMEQYYIINT